MGPKKIALKSAFSPEDDKLALESKLVTLVEPHRHIWDIKDKDYKVNTMRQNTFTSIGEQLGKPGDVCMALWQSLRTQYLAARRALPTGSGAKARSSFRLFDAMSFISGGQDQSQTICNLDGDEDETEHADDEFSTINFADLNDDNIDTSVVPIQTQNSVPESNPRPRSHAKFGGKRKLDSLEEQMLNFVKGGDSKDDEFERFGKTLAAKLRKIHEKDPKAAATCEYELHGVLYKTELDIL
ncbi:uncharacterized protein LOC118435282 [Folsomia candida]|uniref:MADF domain-containing protein n=1 Tax=Folsomia candida TaxID=158441 RepID=A0A226EJZ2_FOLCA|nr:uncharacterized protein LOC118434965 [Folsomia candida]XP_035705786.1 uncharacterized protein LOC118434989 [Folsomia candida]XP_035705865.1 uncharacterized protein LOC118435010 [Folsomia candida]XP_035706943.1 uncharacterized protein LOC118435282 [Folsomia candida]OXA46316.1 hypothetical protein Fcan01_19358 [Folsomia candida]OXA56896.1 hypothetical protein Fcan01_06697 [Folsomia candida]OXA57223.1 hypothetical protein Fcan01_07878 [Folsomia candida]OXA58551.1 hypothetical protein Fcan01_